MTCRKMSRFVTPPPLFHIPPPPSLSHRACLAQGCQVLGAEKCQTLFVLRKEKFLKNDINFYRLKKGQLLNKFSTNFDANQLKKGQIFKAKPGNPGLSRCVISAWHRVQESLPLPSGTWQIQVIWGLLGWGGGGGLGGGGWVAISHCELIMGKKCL